MISIFSLSSSHDDAVTIVVELMTIFYCVLGLSDSFLCSSSKNVGFLLGVAFPILLKFIFVLVLCHYKSVEVGFAGFSVAVFMSTGH